MQKALLILDIDETLIHAAEQTLGRECHFRVAEYHVYLRPYVDVFLRNVSKYFELAEMKRQGFDLNRVLIVEDDPQTVWRSYGNVVYVKPFRGEEHDDELLLLSYYLEAIHDAENFRSLEKRFWRRDV